ncbi:MAG: DUF4012 domain-containing protein [Minisyncoccia bacterium]
MPKKNVPIKNIEPIIVDVKKPNFNYARLKNTDRLNLAHLPQSAAPRISALKKVVLGVLFAGLVFTIAILIVAIGNIRNIKATIAESGGQIASNFTSSANALKNMEPGAAVDMLKANNQSLTEINNAMGGKTGESLFQIIGNAIPIIKNAFGFLGQVTNLNVAFLELAQNIQNLETNGFRDFQNNGQNLITSLTNTHDLIQKINNDTQDVKNSSSNLKNLSSFFNKIDDNISNQYLKYSSELYRWDKAIVGLTNLLNPQIDRHLLVFFENPSEIRPGGGFVGSYADITINGGQMKNMDVRDIYDPDGQLDLKIVPPEQLQTLTTDWGARDANWFFDFPTSAKTIIRFLEASKMYSEKNITFNAAIALNINIVKTMLAATGPIYLPDYKITIDQNNLLYEIQRSVEAGADKKAGQPKKILKTLAPVLLQQLNGLSADAQKNLFDGVKNHLAKKDIMLYVKDEELAGFLAESNLDGAVFGLPNNFWGSYLAVVNANVAGGKSDAFVKEKITANIDVDTNGNTFTNVLTTRTHNGNLEQDPWWKADNKDFIQVFSELNSNLVTVSGNDIKPKYQTMDYKNSDYSVNPDLAAIEKTKTSVSGLNAWTFNAFGKKVFATWLMLKSGQTKTLNMRYETPYNNPVPIGPEQTYALIIEKQSGVDNSLDITVNAPFKYYWAESGDTAFHFTSDNPDKRIIINLTLKKKTDEQY